MRVLKTIWRRLTRDFVDLFLWLTVISLIINLFVEGYRLPDSKDAPEWVLLFFGILIVLYVAGTMWRMGADAELMNEYIKDDADRKSLGMYPYQFRDKARSKGWEAWLFAVIWVGVLALFIIL